jgi:hypothetical protein
MKPIFVSCPVVVCAHTGRRCVQQCGDNPSTHPTILMCMHFAFLRTSLVDLVMCMRAVLLQGGLVNSNVVTALFTHPTILIYLPSAWLTRLVHRATTHVCVVHLHGRIRAQRCSDNSSVVTTLHSSSPCKVQDAHTCVVPLQGGLVYSNAVTTVSPTYANEVLTGGQAGWLRSTLSRPEVKAKVCVPVTLCVLGGGGVEGWLCQWSQPGWLRSTLLQPKVKAKVCKPVQMCVCGWARGGGTGGHLLTGCAADCCDPKAKCVSTCDTECLWVGARRGVA